MEVSIKKDYLYGSPTCVQEQMYIQCIRFAAQGYLTVPEGLLNCPEPTSSDDLITKHYISLNTFFYCVFEIKYNFLLKHHFLI